MNLLAFSRVQTPANHPTVDTIAARLRASYALFKAAADKQVKLFGTPAQLREYIGNPIFADGPPGRIDPLEFSNDALALSYLGSSAIGAEKAVARYAEDAVCPEAVKWFDVVVGKKSLARWIEATIQPPPPSRKGGRPPAFDWPKIEAEALRLVLHHGEFSADDPEWNAQARLEEALLNFCAEEFKREPAIPTVRKRIQGWLKAWREKRQDG